MSRASYEWGELRRLIPRYDDTVTAGDCQFSAEAAERPIDFFRAALKHVKGEWAARKLVLEPWQQALIGTLFGWLRPDGTRRYRECFLYVPRKNGKTTLAAGICNYMLFCDGEPGAEIYCAAADVEQASLVYDIAKEMVSSDPTLKKVAAILNRRIVIEKTASFLKVITAKASSKHGFNSHCVVIDELHAQKDGRLVEALMTSTGSRRQPLILYITTADHAGESICNRKLEYARKVRDGIIADPSFLPVIYEATREDDWTNPDVWKAANPNYGVSVSPEYLKEKCFQAIESRDFENSFRRLHLNVQVEQEHRWIKMDLWDGCAGGVPPSDLFGEKCWAGVDLGSTQDLTALVLAFPREDGSIQILPYFWAPGVTAAAREKKDRVPYIQWSQEGLIQITGGKSTDYEAVRAKIHELAKTYAIQEIAIDPYNATQMKNQLSEDGFTMVEFRQGFISMNEPMKIIDKMLVDGSICHLGNPVLRWMAANVVVVKDSLENLRPDKAKSFERIDGIVAMIMAIARAKLGSRSFTSVYEERGIQWV